jgi:predicted alpha/beta-fold hydrolase
MTPTRLLPTSPFRAPWWLKNAHLQTLWGTLVRFRLKCAGKWERVELEDGHFHDLFWTETPALDYDGPLVAILHGLEGSIESSYAKGMLNAIRAKGWVGVLLHFRGCSGEVNRHDRAYHMGETGDPAWFFDHLQERFPNAKLGAVGYSLGGNVLVKYLGECGRDRQSTPLRAAVSICPPLDLHGCADRLERGFSRLYQKHLIDRMKENLQKKMERSGFMEKLKLGPDGLAGLTTFRRYDDRVVAPLHGFTGWRDYYDRSSGMQFLGTIATPTLLIHTVDDPFMTEAVIARAGALSPSVRYELSEKGGHVGFVTGRVPWEPRYWLEERVPEFLETNLTG